MQRSVCLAQPKKPTLIIMENPQHILIEKYLDGTLPPGERSAFESQLASDPELGRELRVYEAARAALEVQSFIDRRESIHRQGRQMLSWKKWQWKIQDALDSVFVQHREERPDRIRWGLVGGLSLATALFVMYLINPGLFFPQDNSAVQPIASIKKEQALDAYNANFRRIDLSTTLGAADEDSLLQTARNLYTAGNCAEAVTTLDLLLNNPEFNRRPLALLLKGTCQLDMGNAEIAITTLQEVPPAASRLYQDAQWYTALANLKLERSEEASAILQEIAANSSHRHSDAAKTILGSGK